MLFASHLHPLTGPLARVLLLSTMASLAACGGGSSSGTESTPPAETASCNPDDATTADECGVLYLAVTDADGDFLAYSVDLVSLSLERDNGDIVQALPNASRVDFTDYVELTEFVSVRNVPPGRYVAGSITVDYTNAEIMVEKGGAAVPAIVTDEAGTPLTTLTLDVTLAEESELRLVRGLSSLLVVDFDLGASHTVDLDADPVTAVAEPIIAADIEPIDEKDVRVRGPLIDVDETTSTYTVQLRPFYLRSGDYGVVDVIVTPDTVYEIDGVAYVGADGLAELALADTGTLTRAIGTLDVSDRTYTATEVLAGASVPGSQIDAVRGHVTSRNGNTLTVIGAAVIPSDRARYFNETVTVTIGDDTKVFTRDHEDMLPTSAISVGQNVLIRGSLDSGASADVPAIDATQGSVRLLRTRISGAVVAANPGQVDLDLTAIGGRNPDVFDFAGTGPDANADADPDNYEIASGALDVSDFPPGAPAVAYGSVAEFGFAPPDFVGTTLVDLGELRATLGIGWTSEGSTAPFLAIGPDGLVPDPAAFAADARQSIKIGPRIIPLSDIEGGITIAGSEARRTLYGLRDGDSLQLYGEFADFVDAVSRALDGVQAARSLTAQGSYSNETQTFNATTIWLTLVRD